MNPGRDLPPKVVAVHSDIDAADRHRVSPNPAQETGQPLGQMYPPALHAYQDDFGAEVIALGDFMRDTGQGALHGRTVESDGGLGHYDIVSVLAAHSGFK